MLKFCTCGSLLNDDVCTNKNCNLSKASSTKENKANVVKTTKAASVKSSNKTKSNHDRARRSSRCITYRIEDLEKKEGQ